MIRARLLGLGWPQPCAHVSGPLRQLHRNDDDAATVLGRKSLIAADGKHVSRKESLGEDGARNETQRPVRTTMHGLKMRADGFNQTAPARLPAVWEGFRAAGSV